MTLRQILAAPLLALFVVVPSGLLGAIILGIAGLFE